jgi:hypothetical protein
MTNDHSARPSRSRAERLALRRSFFVAVLAALAALTVSGPAFAAAAVPDAPAQPTVTHGDGSISVAFLAPAANGSPIQYFTAGCTSSDGGASAANTDTASPVGVIGLDNGKTYTCTVSATNGVGTGGVSPASLATIPAAVPDSPLKPTVTHGNALLSVAIVPPADHGSAIIGYTATCTSSNGGASGAHSGAASPQVVTGLTNGKTYTCTAVATNGEGPSLASAPSSAAVPAAVPSTPAAPTLTPGDAQISVAFVAPADNGSTIIGYTAACTSSNGGAAGTNDGTVSPIAVALLTNGKTYTCTVLATNGEGPGPVSAASLAAVPATVPSTLAAPAVTAGDRSIRASFGVPADGGSAITSYQVICRSSDGGTDESGGGASSPVVVRELTNGKHYACTVRAWNDVGPGNESVASDTVRAGLPAVNHTKPTITGPAVNHKTLTAHDGSWTGAPTPVLTRRWQRCNLRMTQCVDIAGSVGHTYVLRNADLFHKIRVIVVGKNVFGSTEAHSGPTARIAAG